MIAALQSGRVAAAGLDVFNNEPAIHPGYLALENVVLLPHIGSATVETRNAMGFLALEGMRRSSEGETDPRRMALLQKPVVSAPPKVLREKCASSTGNSGVMVFDNIQNSPCATVLAKLISCNRAKGTALCFKTLCVICPWQINLWVSPIIREA